MSHGKYLSLEEARNLGKLRQFAKEHPCTGDGEKFDRLLDAMVKPRSSPTADQTSTPASSEDCTETQTRPGTLKDADG